MIGINTIAAVSGRGASVENIGFAIPIDQAMTLVERLRRYDTALGQRLAAGEQI